MSVGGPCQSRAYVIILLTVVILAGEKFEHLLAVASF